LSGCDYLATITAPTAIADSAVIQSFLLNPQRLVQGSRLAVFGTLWDKYKFKKLQLVYEPSVGTGTAGALCLSADPDVLDDYSSIKGNILIQKLSSTAHNLTTPMFMPAVLNISDKRFFDRELYTEPEDQSDPRNCYAGRIWVTTAGGLASGTYGRLYLKWKVWFSNPNLDEEFEDGTAMIGAFNGSYVNSTYPWGNFDQIITDFPNANGYVPADFVVFKSDATKGSVIEFQAPGFYLISIYRSGAAMGTGAFTSATFSGCTTNLPTNSTGWATGYNFAIANSGSTASMWICLLYASASGAYVSSTGDSGVTHTISNVSVSRFDFPTSANGGLSLSPPVTKSGVEMMIAQMRSDFESKLALLNPSAKVGLGLPVMSSAISETADEIPDPSGAPRQHFTLGGTGVYTQDLAIETVAAGLKDRYYLVPREAPASPSVPKQ